MQQFIIDSHFAHHQLVAGEITLAEAAAYAVPAEFYRAPAALTNPDTLSDGVTFVRTAHSAAGDFVYYLITTPSPP